MLFESRWNGQLALKEADGIVYQIQALGFRVSGNEMLSRRFHFEHRTYRG